MVGKRWIRVGRALREGRGGVLVRQSVEEWLVARDGSEELPHVERKAFELAIDGIE
jgi:hypothetical protein